SEAVSRETSDNPLRLIPASAPIPGRPSMIAPFSSSFGGKYVHVSDPKWLAARKRSLEAKIPHLHRREYIRFQAAPGAVTPVRERHPVFSVHRSLDDVVRVWRRFAMPLRVAEINELGQLVP